MLLFLSFSTITVTVTTVTLENVSDKIYLKIVIHTFRMLDEEIGKSKAVRETNEKKHDVSGTKEGDG